MRLRNRSRANVIVVLFSSALLLPAAVGQTNAPAPPGEQPPQYSPSAPTLPTATSSPVAPSPTLDFSFSDLKGGGHRLSAFRGNIVLLEFWASWCLPCREGFPFLEKVQEAHAAGGLKVMAVTLEDEEAPVRSFVAGFPGTTFLVGRDPSGKAGEIFEVNAMPTAILLDREGKILTRFEGGTEAVHNQIEKTVGAVMRGETLAATAVAKGAKGPKGNLRAWERGCLADPIMSLDGDPLTRSMRDHIHSSKEAAVGDGGIAGGGCGCN